MKSKVYFTACLICFTVGFHGLYAQNYLIHFTGSGLSTAVTTVYVTNLDQGTTVTLAGTDTLHLFSTSGIHEEGPDGARGSVKVYPNPLQDECQVGFINPASGQVVFEIFEVTGKRLLREEWQCSKGSCQFRAGGLKEGVYIFQITASGKLYDERIAVLGSHVAKPWATLVSHEKTDLPQGKLAGDKNTILMAYENGERLLFRGVYSNYSRMLTMVPTQSQAVDFEFIACTDGNGKHYPVVTIGTQTWMAKNLKATKYNNGTTIPIITDGNTWMNFTTPAYCWFNNDSATYADTYGAMYKWYVGATGNLCPVGWHMPTQPEWLVLRTLLGGDTLAGGKLKETGFVHWDSLNVGATNETGFTGLPGGMRFVGTGNFQDMGHYGYFWTSNDYSTSFAYCHSLAYDNRKLTGGGLNKGNGFAVRCLKD